MSGAHNRVCGCDNSLEFDALDHRGTRDELE
jgi:hypothetical protein